MRAPAVTSRMRMAGHQRMDLRGVEAGLGWVCWCVAGSVTRDSIGRDDESGRGGLGLADAEEVIEGADEQLALGDGGGGEAFFVEVILGDYFEGGTGADDAGFTVVTNEIDEVIGSDEGGVMESEAF